MAENIFSDPQNVKEISILTPQDSLAPSQTLMSIPVRWNNYVCMYMHGADVDKLTKRFKLHGKVVQVASREYILYFLLDIKNQCKTKQTTAHTITEVSSHLYG